jgi:hypothetical protein
MWLFGDVLSVLEHHACSLPQLDPRLRPESTQRYRMPLAQPDFVASCYVLAELPKHCAVGTKRNAGSLRFDPKLLDDGPPFCSVGLHHRAEHLWRLLFAREKVHFNFDKA